MSRFYFNLKIFDGEGAGEAGGADTESAQQLATVNEETGDDSAPSAENEPELSEKDIFDRFISEHKEEYEKRIKSTLDRRMRGYNKLKSQTEKLQSYVDRQLARTGAKSIDELTSRLDSDDNYYRTASAEAGMSEEAFRELESYRMKDLQNSRMQEERDLEERRQQLYREIEEVKSVYPDFDINAERDNPVFNDLVNSGVPMLHAYRISHYEALVNSAIAAARREASRETTESIRSKQNRPSEYGTGKGSGASPKVDILKFTEKDCEEYERRASRGEIITFKS